MDHSTCEFASRCVWYHPCLYLRMLEYAFRKTWCVGKNLPQQFSRVLRTMYRSPFK